MTEHIKSICAYQNNQIPLNSTVYDMMCYLHVRYKHAFALRVPTLASGFDGGACRQRERDALLGGEFSHQLS